MIKGFLSLFTSGIIFNPLVLLGVVCGAMSVIALDFVTIRKIVGMPEVYLAVALLSAVYVWIFKKQYKDDGISIDWLQIILSIVGGMFRFVLSYVLTIALVAMLAF